MKKLWGMKFAGMTIIEHRAVSNIVGKITTAEVNVDGSLGLYWNPLQDQDRYGRTTPYMLFLPSSWQCEIVAGVIFLKRIAEDPPNGENTPWTGANLYTIFRQAD